MTATPLLRRATLEDLDCVMRIERRPGYERLVARWTREQHLEAAARPDVAYLLCETPGAAPLAFAIVEALDNVHEGAKLKRIAVESPGCGVGGAFLKLLLAWVFESTPAARLWLDVFSDNERARRAYRRAGFTEDGVLRQAYVLPSGERVDRVLMSVLRSEWERA